MKQLLILTTLLLTLTVNLHAQQKHTLDENITSYLNDLHHYPDTSVWSSTIVSKEYVTEKDFYKSLVKNFEDIASGYLEKITYFKEMDKEFVAQQKEQAERLKTDKAFKDEFTTAQKNLTFALNEVTKSYNELLHKIDSTNKYVLPKANNTIKNKPRYLVRYTTRSKETNAMTDFSVYLYIDEKKNTIIISEKL